jgi:hypothetical protein
VVVLLDGGCVDHRGDHTTLGAVVLHVGGLLRGKLVDGVPSNDRPVPRVPVHLHEADRPVTTGVGAGHVDEDGLLQLLELCPELEGLVVDGGHVVGGLVFLELKLEAANVADQGVAQLLQLGLLEDVELDRPIPDVVKGQVLPVGGTDRAAGHRGGKVDTPEAVAHVALVTLSLALALRNTFVSLASIITSSKHACLVLFTELMISQDFWCLSSSVCLGSFSLSQTLPPLSSSCLTRLQNRKELACSFLILKFKGISLP